MTRQKVTRAIILAAGMGSRLGEGLPKPLRSVAGVPLLVRVLRTLASEGIEEAVIVTGYASERVQSALVAADLDLRLRFVENPRYEAKNGVSLLAASDLVDRECILAMADHLVSSALVRRLLDAELPEGCCALGVDFDVPRCFDLDDATKVRLCGRTIVDIGKELDGYDALDTGVFRIGPALLRELAVLEAMTGDCSLSDGVRALAGQGAFFGVDVGRARWIDVDTPEALERAEAMLRVFGDNLSDAPDVRPQRPESLDVFAPSWVRAAKPYNEDHFALAEDRQSMLRLMSNESPYGPSPRVLQAIVDAALNGNRYPSRGMELRQRLGARDGLEPSSVILGAGSAELIDIIIRTFVSPGEEVLIGVPTFSMYETRTRAVGGIPVLVPITQDVERDVTALVEQVTERTKVVFLCTPNNPTGHVVPEGELRRVLRLGLPTVIDEAYFEFGDAASNAHLVREFPNAIVLRTFSKAHGLAGLRLGYALAQPAAVDLLSRVRVPWNVPGVVLAAAIAALDDDGEFRARLSEMRVERARLVQQLSAIPGLRCQTSEGNFVLVDVSSSGFGADELVKALVDQGVLVRSLSTHHGSRHFVRVTVGQHHENTRCVSGFRRVVAGRAATTSVWAAGDAE